MYPVSILFPLYSGSVTFILLMLAPEQLTVGSETLLPVGRIFHLRCDDYSGHVLLLNSAGLVPDQVPVLLWCAQACPQFRQWPTHSVACISRMGRSAASERPVTNGGSLVRPGPGGGVF